jgi:hypothetical protein
VQNISANGAIPSVLPVNQDSFRQLEKIRGRRCRTSVPPTEQRSWLALAETAMVIGCSKATLHRLRRGEIEGVPRLPAVQVGKRKWVVLKASLAEWQRENERLPAT